MIFLSICDRRGAMILSSVGLFIAAGLCEIGGGYLVWLWLREGRGLVVGVLLKDPELDRA